MSISIVAGSWPGSALTAVLTLTVLLLAGCAVGPDHEPPTPRMTHFLNATAAAEPLPASAAPAPDLFWEAFDDPMLIELVDLALASNPDLRILAARRDQARALLGQARADRRPTLGVDAAAQEVDGASDLEGQSSSGAQLDLLAGWEADLFGRLRREIEARGAEADAASADLAAAQTAVVGELAQAWFELRGLQARVETARADADSQAEILRMLGLRFETGSADRLEVDRAEALLETTRAAVPMMETEAAAALNRIAVLTGLAPSEIADQIPRAGRLPQSFPPAALDAPADLLRRRPDVVAAERRLAAATVRIGVAEADRLPRVSLGALIGWTDAGGDPVRGLTAGAISTLDFGRGRARVAVADAEAEEAFAAWERTVLLAVEEIETALATVARSGEWVDRLTRAADAAGRAVTAARARFRVGEGDALDLLDAERTRLAAEDALVEATTRRAQAHVALYRALAGGWPGRPRSTSARLAAAAQEPGPS